MAETIIGAGFRALWYGVNDANGEFIGGTATAPAAGNTTGSGLIRLNGARTLPVNIPEPDIITVSGDDEPMVQFEFDSESLPSGAFEMSARDNTFEALIQGTKVHTVGSAEYSMLDPKGRASQSMCLLLQRRAKSWKSGERGANKWEVVFIKQCTIKPLYATVEQRTHTPYQYSFNASRADLGLGFSINQTEHGTTAMSVIIGDFDNPVHYQRFTGDNATQTYTLPYTPVSGARSYVYLDHIQQTVTTNYSISGTSLIFVAAPGTNVKIEVVYEVAEGDLF